MVMIIMSVILFGFGGWYSLEYIYLFAHVDYIPGHIDYESGMLIFMWCVAGFIVGFSLSSLLSKFVARKYPINEKDPLLPFSDGETYLVNNNGEINYHCEEGYVRTASRNDVAYIKVDEKEVFPYVAYCHPKRDSFWGLFATFILSPCHTFVLPKETMIKKGRVDIITKKTFKLVLE